jgi:hypothetical protein
MKILGLKKTPFIIFLILVFMPIVGAAGIFLESQFNLGSNLIFFVLLIPAFITTFIVFPFISPLFKFVGIDLGATGLFTGGPTFAGYIVAIVLHVAVSFAIAKIINLFFKDTAPAVT